MTKIKYLVIAMELVLVMGLIGFKLMTGKAVLEKQSLNQIQKNLQLKHLNLDILQI